MEPALEPVFACAPPPGTARVDVVLATASGTAAERVLRRLPEGYPPVLVATGRGPGGLGAAWAQGLAATTAPVVALVDGTSGVDLRELERVAEPVARGSADLVLGARRPDRDLAALAAWPPHRRLADRAAARRAAARLEREGLGEALRRLAPLLPPLLDAGRVLAGRRQLLLPAAGSPAGAGPEGLLVAAATGGWRTAQVGVRCGRRTR